MLINYFAQTVENFIIKATVQEFHSLKKSANFFFYKNK